MSCLASKPHKNITRFLSSSKNDCRLKLSVFDPNSHHLQEVLIFCYNIKKSASQGHPVLTNTHGKNKNVLWKFRRWKIGGTGQSQEKLIPSFGGTLNNFKTYTWK